MFIVTKGIRETKLFNQVKLMSSNKKRGGVSYSNLNTSPTKDTSYAT